MAQLTRFGVSMPENLLTEFDRVILNKGYDNRSEALRDMVRNYLVEEAVANGHRHVVGTVTIVFDHHTPGLGQQLTAVQHRYPGMVVSTMHVHLCADDCLEVIAVKGRLEEVKGLANELESLRGVKRAKLTLATAHEEELKE